MSVKHHLGHLLTLSLLTLGLSSCYKPPYNNFDDDHRMIKEAVIGAGIGAGAGAAIGSLGGGTGTAVGAVVGSVTGASIGILKNLQPTLIKEIEAHDIQYIHYGDTMTMIIPTDRYFAFNSPQLNDRSYIGLAAIVRLLRKYPNSPIYVAGFSDDVGSRHHKKTLTQAQAETMLTYLWANDVHAQRLQAEGYGDKHDIGDNHWIRGSAYNRRIEIQWLNVPKPRTKPAPYLCALK
jgi:outer membrane protein OmpA-like peptidoglycan-associated protein